jgi:hypothetical protein
MRSEPHARSIGTGVSSVDLQRVKASTISGVKQLSDDLRRFAQVERILGGVLLFTPVLLVWFDTRFDSNRDSISAYYDMSTPPAFYVPLTVGAMLFFENGIVRREHWYNIVLGVALTGVILLDHEWAPIPHFVSAGVFFGLNFVVMMLFSTNKTTLIKLLAVVGLVAALALWRFASLFWAEWVSLGIIAAHFILDSSKWSAYRALEPGEAPKLLSRKPANGVAEPAVG